MTNDKLEKLLGVELVRKLGEIKVLMIGAGGIGCELLKNLCKSGINHITVIDLDTIDLSNLNRQFLFRQHNINQSKALVAKDSVLKFNPLVDIDAFHASIYEERFDVDFYKKHAIVLNALDNVAARQHVNRMCLAANVPLIESGTAGYLGQVSVHIKDKTACYDCSPKDSMKKTFPVCTIRSTPSEPIHCIVWAKSWLFSNLFSSDDHGDIILDGSNGDSHSDSNLRKYLEIDGGCEKLFEKLFNNDIQQLLNTMDGETMKKRPSPLCLKKIRNTKLEETLPNSLEYDQKVWSLHLNTVVFMQSFEALAEELKSETCVNFDKDNVTMLNFITSASNLRSFMYSIPLLTRFKVKEMAGNIIPAIATTNAIIAGMIVILVFQIFDGKDPMQLNNTFLIYGGDRKHFLMNECGVLRNPKCYICGIDYIQLKYGDNQTLRDFLNFIKDMNRFEGDLSVIINDNLVYDVEYEDNIDKFITQLDDSRQPQLLVSDEIGSKSIMFLCVVGDIQGFEMLSN